jgi:hypothetical protein
VTYLNGKIPFTIVEQYTPSADGTIPGLYDKVALPPTSSDENNGQHRRRLDLVLPTVVVDATSSVDGDAPYETMTLYSCVEVGPTAVVELIFASKNESLSTADLQALEATARAAGVVWNDSDLNLVDQSGCK